MWATWQDIAAGAGVLDLDPTGLPERPLVLVDLDQEGAPPDDLPIPSAASGVVVGVTAGDPPLTALVHLTCWVTPDEVDDLSEIDPLLREAMTAGESIVG